MDYFDKSMALDVIEDAITAASGDLRNHGFAIGLCGAFYICGILSQTEWEAFLNRIQKIQDHVSKTCGAEHGTRDTDKAARKRVGRAMPAN